MIAIFFNNTFLSGLLLQIQCLIHQLIHPSHPIIATTKMTTNPKKTTLFISIDRAKEIEQEQIKIKKIEQKRKKKESQRKYLAKKKAGIDTKSCSSKWIGKIEESLHEGSSETKPNINPSNVFDICLPCQKPKEYRLKHADDESQPTGCKCNHCGLGLQWIKLCITCSTSYGKWSEMRDFTSSSK